MEAKRVFLPLRGVRQLANGSCEAVDSNPQFVCHVSPLPRAGWHILCVCAAFSLVTEVEPEVLLLDEILSVGEEFFQRKCQERLQQIMRRGATTVIVSHNLDHLVSQCERLIWLNEGKLVADGPAAEVARAYRACLGHSAGAKTAP